ncbi:MAG TPA: mechanosensitive ion channel family protein [Firmicutes bacterium]|jgi:MscS family membrane protein|nr:mechanosensitive ion channel family protein [Bacillota bacterium]
MMKIAEGWIAFTEAGLLRPAAALLVFLLLLLFRNSLTRLIFSLVSKLAARSKAGIDISFFMALENPLKNFILLLGIYIAATILPLPSPWQLYFTVLFRILIVIFVAWALYNLAESPMIRSIGRRVGFDTLLIDFLIKAIKAVIAALAVIIVVQQLGYDINGFIAGLGLGGLAVALAAKDALANIFAGIVIIADKPFSVGDWIATSEVEGTVEQVSFRSTKIRTFAQALVTVPNAVLANEAVTNWSRMGRRRVSFTLKVALGTSREKVKSSVEQIREMLQKETSVHPETILVNFEEFGESSLEIMIYFFTKTTAYAEYLTAREAINLKILEILEDGSVELAIPAQKIHLASPNDG